MSASANTAKSARAPYILLDDQLGGTAREYTAPDKVLTIYKTREIAAALQTLEAWHKDGYYLAGYLSYEAGLYFESKLRAGLPDVSSTPYLQFAAFKNFQSLSEIENLPPSDIALNPLWTRNDYLARFERLKAYIASGDVYQVNLTFPMLGRFKGSARELYAQLRPRQPVHYGGIISLGEGPDIISLSPELFFKKSGQSMTMQPMKGTLKRSANKAEDIRQRAAMRRDEKSRAENLMIVDLLRNDLSRISKAGTVKVPELYALETYPTLHQMTSKVTAQLRRGIEITDVFKALFPCGSVTGAPKIRAMEIISELEGASRGAYCGAMGFIDPDGSACFNVGIRTLTLEAGEVTYNVGSGVVADSCGAAEYEECLLKAEVVRGQTPARLLETFRREANGMIPRAALHKDRLSTSAKVLGYDFRSQDWEAAITALTATPSDMPERIRLSLSPSGEIETTRAPLTPLGAPLKLVISKNPLSLSVQETRFKTEARAFYDHERARLKASHGADEVLLMNKGGFLCEGSFTSLFVRTKMGYLTPEIGCGLLPGVLRAALINGGQAKTAMIKTKDLRGAEIYMGNSLRGLMLARLLTESPC
jgi:para-aminobenzoate synthetase/4-amino-4-deoxychorismate lyase